LGLALRTSVARRLGSPGIVGHHHDSGASNAQVCKQRDSNLSGQPFVTMGGGALPLPLPMPTQPATLTATRVATKTVSTFFIGVPLFHAREVHFAPRCTIRRALPSMVRHSRPLRRGLCPWGHSRHQVNFEFLLAWGDDKPVGCSRQIAPYERPWGVRRRGPLESRAKSGHLQQITGMMRWLWGWTITRVKKRPPMRRPPSLA